MCNTIDVSFIYLSAPLPSYRAQPHVRLPPPLPALHVPGAAVAVGDGHTQVPGKGARGGEEGGDAVSVEWGSWTEAVAMSLHYLQIRIFKSCLP